MTYEPGSTHVRTIADEALAAGHGVCQDFAHVMIGVCRLHGDPGRYVSGYLFDPQRDGQRQLGHRTPGSTCGIRIEAGCRSTRRTTASRRHATFASASGETTPTCRPPAASTRARRGRSSRSRCGSASPEASAQTRPTAARQLPAAGAPERRRSLRRPRQAITVDGSPIWLEIARISIAGTPASAAAATQHSEALHRLDRAASRTCRADGARSSPIGHGRRAGSTPAPRQRAEGRAEPASTRRMAADEVAVDGLGPDHERPGSRSRPPATPT